MISNNAKNLHLIHRLSSVCERLATLNVNDSYELMRQTSGEQCAFLGCDFLVIGQASQGYADLQSCEDSELLTDIAHGLHLFIKGPFKFDVKRKQDLKDVFLSFAEKLRTLARATVNELNRLDCGLSFELGYVSSFTDEVINVTNTKTGESYKVSNMSYVYREIKAGLEAAQLEAEKKALNFEAVITDSVLAEIDKETKEIVFDLPGGELVGLGIQKSRDQWLVLVKHLGRVGSHLATRRADIKKNGYLLDNAAQICKELREFMGMQIADTDSEKETISFTCENHGVVPGLYGNSHNKTSIHMVKDSGDPVFVINQCVDVIGDTYNRDNTKQVQEFTNQLTQTNGAYFAIRGQHKNPFEFLEYIKANGDKFTPFTSAKVESGHYQISGNLEKISAVFGFRFYDESLFRLFLQQARRIDSEFDGKYDCRKPLTTEELTSAIKNHLVFDGLLIKETKTIELLLPEGHEMIVTIKTGKNTAYHADIDFYNSQTEHVYNLFHGFNNERDLHVFMIEALDGYANAEPPLKTEYTANDGFCGWGVACGSDIDAQQVIKYGFELRGDRLYPDDMPAIKKLLGDQLEATEIDYHENAVSSKQFARVVKIKRVHRPFIDGPEQTKPLFDLDKLTKKLCPTDIMKYLSNGQCFWDTLDSKIYGQYLSVNIKTTENGYRAKLHWSIQNETTPYKKNLVSAEKLETLIKAVRFEVEKWNTKK